MDRLGEQPRLQHVDRRIIVDSPYFYPSDMTDAPLPTELADDIEIHYVYLIACHGPLETYVKVGMTCNLKRRISDVQTSCPFRIAHAFAIPSEYSEEAREGLNNAA